MYVYQLKFRSQRKPGELAAICHGGQCPVGGVTLCPFGACKPCCDVVPEDWMGIYLGTMLLPLEREEAE